MPSRKNVRNSRIPCGRTGAKSSLSLLLIAAVLIGGAFDATAQERIVNVSGWADYIDPKVLESFTKETGIRVTYDAFDSTEQLEGQLRRGQDSFDVMIVPGRELDRQIAAGQFQKLDRSKLPNSKNLWPEVTARLGIYDPGNQYAVNYLWFTLGLAYNAGRLSEEFGDAEADTWRGASGEAHVSWDVLFRPDLLRRLADCGVAVPDSGDDMLAIALIYLKADPASVRPSELKRAGDLLSGLRHYAKFETGDSSDALANGDICLAVGSSIDSFRARERARAADGEADIGFAIPREGSLMILDNLVIPAKAQHVEEAYAFIDFLLRPEVAARNMNFTHLASGVPGAKAAIDPRLAKTASLAPDEQVVRRLYAAPSRSPASQKAVSREWARAKTGK